MHEYFALPHRTLQTETVPCYDALTRSILKGSGLPAAEIQRKLEFRAAAAKLRGVAQPG